MVAKMVTSAMLPAFANPLDALRVFVLSIVDLFRPRVIGFAYHPGDGDGGDGGAGGGGGGGSNAGAGGSGDGDEGDDEGEDDEHAKLVKDLGEKGAAEVVKLRREAAKHRKAAADAAAALKAREDADLSEAEKAKKRADEAEAARDAAVSRANEALIIAEVKIQSAALQAVDADAVVKLIDREGITVDDDGTVKGAKKAVETLLKARPYLKSGGGGQGRSGADHEGGSGEDAGTGDMNNAIRRAAGRI
jgi:uncharacterized membrane protein YgcG